MVYLSIIIPAYNEEKRIGKTLVEYGRFFKERQKNKELKGFEIIVVLNACRDNTIGVVKAAKKKFKEIRYLNFKQGGKGFAIIEGFKDALKRKNELIGFVDADMSTLPEAFYDLVENIDGFDGIIASRWLKESKINSERTFLRKIYSIGFNYSVRMMFLVPYRDTQCGAKLFTRELVKGVLGELKLTQWAFDVNLLYSASKRGFKVKEQPTIWEDKAGSNIKSRTPLQMFLGVLRLRLIYSIFEPILRPVKFILHMGDKLISKK